MLETTELNVAVGKTDHLQMARLHARPVRDSIFIRNIFQYLFEARVLVLAFPPRVEGCKTAILGAIFGSNGASVIRPQFYDKSSHQVQQNTCSYVAVLQTHKI